MCWSNKKILLLNFKNGLALKFPLHLDQRYISDDSIDNQHGQLLACKLKKNSKWNCQSWTALHIILLYFQGLCYSGFWIWIAKSFISSPKNNDKWEVRIIQNWKWIMKTLNSKTQTKYVSLGYQPILFIGTFIFYNRERLYKKQVGPKIISSFFRYIQELI